MAPDAQILAMKVFDDAATGAMEYTIISALEDAARLGADVINLSLGSDNGFAQDDTAAREVYNRLSETGVLFMVSAGNSYYSSYYSNYGDYGLADNPEISMIASPAAYDGTLSVASVNSTVSSAPYLNWTDAQGAVHDVAYDDPNTAGAFRSKFAAEGALPINIIPVDGYGAYGTYVEGFLSLSQGELSEAPTLCLPMLAFYGDWSKDPIYDNALRIDEVSEGGSYEDLESTWGTTFIGYYDGYSFQNLGQNVFDSNSATTQTRYYQENITISPTGIMLKINDYSLHQLREAKLVVVEVTDKETGELYFRDFSTYQFKDYYYSSVGSAVPSSQQYFIEQEWDGTDLEGNVLPSNTQCVMTITAYGEGEYPMVMNENVGYRVTDFEAVVKGEAVPTFNDHPMDMTGDGQIRVSDVARIYAHVRRVGELTGYLFQVGDVDGNGELTVADVSRIYAHTRKTAFLF